MLASILRFMSGASDPWIWQSARHLSTGALAVRYFSQILVALAYFPALMRATNGRTVGKFVMGIRVVRTDGKPMTATRAAWREGVLKLAIPDLIGVIPLLGDAISTLVLLVDDLWPVGHSENAAIHDLLGRTRVIKDRGRNTARG